MLPEAGKFLWRDTGITEPLFRDAGGITSAAMDGIRVAEEVALALAGEATGAGVKVSTDTEGGRG